MKNINLYEETSKFLAEIGLDVTTDILYMSNEDRSIFILPHNIKNLLNSKYDNKVYKEEYVSVCSDLVVQLKDGNYLTRTLKDIGGSSREVWKLNKIIDKEVAVDVFSRSFLPSEPSEASFDIKLLTKEHIFEDSGSAIPFEEGDEDEEEMLVYLTTLEKVSEHASSLNIIYGVAERENVSTMCSSDDIIF